MKKFADKKKLAVIKQQCKEAGIHFSDRLYRQGSDFVCITTVEGNNYSGQVLYNTVNGTFFGTTPDGVSFDSQKIEHEGDAWFQALLSFFYVEKQ